VFLRPVDGGTLDDMRAELFLHGRQVGSVFELLGTGENDITYSLGWALSQSPMLRRALLRRVFPKEPDLAIDRVALQERRPDSGITDIEMTGPHAHVIVEAKRGWQVPARRQLALYAPRLRAGKRPHRALVAMSECAADFAALHLETRIDGVPVVHIAWRDLAAMARFKQGTHAERRLSTDLRTYLQRIVKMQNQESNLVYVVSLGSDRPAWSRLTWIEIVEKRNRYFHPIGTDGWPKEPPNYIGFRYRGQLRRIQHIEGWKVITDLHAEMPDLGNPGRWEPHFLYSLGPPILPTKPIKNGGIYPNGRVWAMLDLLLTSDTVADARDITKRRQAVAE
jgi:hypothetical protein